MIPVSSSSNRTRRAEPISRRVAKNGRVTYTFQVDTGQRPDGRRIRQRFTYSTLAEARREFRRVTAEVNDGRFIGRTRQTLDEVCDAWLLSRRDIRANTARNYRDALGYVRQNDIGAMPVQDLRQQHIDTWVAGLAESGGRGGKPLAPATVRLALVTLRQVCEYAARQGLIARDPAQYVQAPRQRVQRVDASDVWTREEVWQFMESAAEHRLHAAFLLSTFGLRRSEVCGLRWSDLDLTKGTLSVEQGHVEVSGSEHAIDAPKTSRSRRTLPLPTDATAALRALRARQQQETLAIGIPWDEDRHVCSNEDGSPVLPRTFTGWFRRISKNAGLRPITLRNLRHTSVSVMLHRGIPASTVAAWHGHDVRMTTSVYGRVYDDGLVTAAAAMFGDDTGDAPADATGR